ncbi:GTP 3',8-cyclase MoaA [Brevibacillus ginsengisoli]|uniref:GTP 3',8-cyclase MoaA n=1 Tax=Brevibacillus ginsengisoli TaxID=363854 RepID=UPI003CF753B6
MMSLPNQPLMDHYGRIHDYLRISVTDRCNLKCIYCRPEQSIEHLETHQILRDEEIEEVVKAATKLGVKRIRITGGEPLVRPGLEKLIGRLISLPGIEEIAMTTNGIMLAERAKQLKQAGLSRVNISLDSCNPDRYRQMTRGGDLHRVLKAIDASLAVGFEPVKLNVVLIKGFNDDEIDDFLNMTKDRPLHVRFIEYMPIGQASPEWQARYLPLTTVMERAEAHGLTVPIKDQILGNGPSEYYKLPDAMGTFGLIHPVSNHFCHTCNRLRLTADGYLKPCLYWSDETNIRPFIHDSDALEQQFFSVLSQKPEQHEMTLALANHKQNQIPTIRWMSQIGG